MAFHLGSLGFLTPFQFDNFQEQVTNVLEGHAALTLRSRLRCVIYRKTDRRKDSSELTQQLNCSMSADSGVSMDSCSGIPTVGKGCSRTPSTNILVRFLSFFQKESKFIIYLYDFFKGSK